jgi:hypothetical protein
MTTHTVALRGERLAAAALGAADWVCFAAAPTFAIMALLAGVLGGGAQDTFCSAAQDASPLSGMVWMYMLMNAFHSAPWLKLISSRPKRRPRRQSYAGGRQVAPVHGTTVRPRRSTGSIRSERSVRVASSARTIRTREHEREQCGRSAHHKGYLGMAHLRSYRGRSGGRASTAPREGAIFDSPS